MSFGGAPRSQHRLATPVIDAVRRWKGMAKRKKANAKQPWVSSQDLLHSVLYDVMTAAPTRAADAWRAQEGHGGGAFKTYRSADCLFNGPNGRHVRHALVEPRSKLALLRKLVGKAGYNENKSNAGAAMHRDRRAQGSWKAMPTLRGVLV